MTAETLLYITDEPSNSKPIPTSTSNHATTKSRPSTSSYPPTTNGSSPTLKYPPATFTTLTSATRLDLALLPPPHLPDPLPPTLYHAPHRRAQRAEKQLRNIEKERAMHEKVQLERLLDGLKGHDWLRTMGISGITDSEKRLYEPKREYFVNEVRVLLKKFQQWKEEEKRRKVEKEESMMDEDEEQDEDDDDDKSDDNPPDYNDVDASPTRQLHREALLSTPTSRSHHKKPPSSSLPQPPPFTTFYTKPYLREAAISRHRRGRARYAFGQPLPEPAEREFELGGEILTGEVVERVERGRRGGG